MKKREARLIRKLRVRGKINGTAQAPRLSIFRSNKYLFVQAINDTEQRTILGQSSKLLQGANKTDEAKMLATDFAKKLESKGITKLVFDRNGYKFHGRVKMFAMTLKELGIQI